MNPVVYIAKDDDAYAAELSYNQMRIAECCRYVVRTRRTGHGSYNIFVVKSVRDGIGLKPGEVNMNGDDLLYFLNCGHLRKEV